MSESPASQFGINSWLEDELFQQYQHDQRSVDESWKSVFDRSNGDSAAPAQANGAPAAKMPTTTAVQRHAPSSPPVSTAVSAPAHQTVAGEQLVPLRGAAARIAENMTASLSIPTATSQRVIAVKVIDENRRILNEHRAMLGKSKISYTHIIAWAIVKAVETNPTLNHAYAQMDGEPLRAIRNQLNLGIAVDVAGKDGTRSLKVPNIKHANTLTFEQFLEEYDGIVARARKNKLLIQDFEGTTISLTNPGTVGTSASVPRLMPGQGAIIATGAIDYPPEYAGVNEEFRSTIGLSKVMTVTCTYDHRVIQGAESGMFLARLQDLLQGADDFYEGIFSVLRIPHRPIHLLKEPASLAPVPRGQGGEDIAKQAAVIQLVHAFRVRGHLDADVNPLDLGRESHPELDPASYGLTIWDLDREFFIGPLKLADSEKKFCSLRQILEVLRQTYCGKVGAEYMHIQIPEEKLWLQERMEPTRNQAPLENGVRLRALEQVIEAEEFEHFLHTRFIGQKRFSLEGSESAVVILDEVLDRAANTGVVEAVMGMAHRGRLNILANIVGKSMGQMFSEFEGIVDPFSAQGSGDVKYHLGATGIRKCSNGREITVALAFNPSHLEAVSPVVEGIVRPKQDLMLDFKRERVIPILIHGDAAFAGQGVVAETLNLSQLEGYTTGGTIHLVINNQIGFTTNPNESRSSPYSTDIARMVQAPIFHVNGDDPEACVRVARIAYDFRQQFKKDVVIDMVCYRRHGHNEADDPSYTQPIMYRKIKDHASVAVQYGQRLIKEKLTDADVVADMRKAVSTRMNAIYDQSKKSRERFQVGELSAVSRESIDQPRPNTAVDQAMLEKVVYGITNFPANFHLHPKLKSLVEKRKEVLNNVPMDWAMGEILAFGSLVLEGTPVRLSGQDSGRGTFSQRHLEYFDYETGEVYVPLQHLAAKQGRFNVVDSSLSEYAVMGFEFGYSVADPLTLVMWEAQFGDFANGAQIMIDQFISSAESKWAQPSGLVLLLPHGYEGQGPEHSSGRMERFLQSCAEDNMQVVNASTPAQYFHLLRRQMHGGGDRRGIRKPLIVFTPKRMLRHPKAVSTIGELMKGGFSEVCRDTSGLDPNRVERIVFCSGQIYYDLAQSREERKAGDVALVRIEQLYPFPAAEVEDVLSGYPVEAEVVWAQEEPKNMGAWHSIQESMQPLLEPTHRTLRYVGRQASASPAAGSLKRHQLEQSELIGAVFAAGEPSLHPELAISR